MGQQPRTRHDRTATGAVASLGGAVGDFVNQLREFVGQAGGSVQRLPSVGLPSPPGALSAAQIQTIAAGVSAQRTQIAAVTDQLAALDGQLAVLERLLEPLVLWCSTWADLEKAVANLLPKSGTEPATD